MKYQYVDEDQKRRMIESQVQQIEQEHFTNDVARKRALSIKATDEVANFERNMERLEAQHEMLVAELGTGAEEEDDEED
jgi:hypothetical protein